MQLADGSVIEYEVVVPIEVRFKNRRYVRDAMVIPGDNELLPGVISLEDMAVLFHAYRRELIVNYDYPFFAQIKLK